MILNLFLLSSFLEEQEREKKVNRVENGRFLKVSTAESLWKQQEVQKNNQAELKKLHEGMDCLRGSESVNKKESKVKRKLWTKKAVTCNFHFFQLRFIVVSVCVQCFLKAFLSHISYALLRSKSLIFQYSQISTYSSVHVVELGLINLISFHIVIVLRFYTNNRIFVLRHFDNSTAIHN